jgi:hypothetical protein
VHLVTPISSSIAIPLIQGLRNEVVVHQPDAATLFPNILVKDYRSAVQAALKDLHPDTIGTSVTDMRISERWGLTTLCLHSRGMVIESQKIDCDKTPERAFAIFGQLGGPSGWLGLDWTLRLRGWCDRLFGGKGFNRSGPNQSLLKLNDQVDCFTVEQVDRPNHLLLKINYKLPGQGWLRFTVQPKDNHQSTLGYTVYFAPKGLLGVIYWYAVLLPHRVVFRQLLKRIAVASVTQQPHLAE